MNTTLRWINCFIVCLVAITLTAQCLLTIHICNETLNHMVLVRFDPNPDVDVYVDGKKLPKHHKIGLLTTQTYHIICKTPEGQIIQEYNFTPEKESWQR